MPIDDSQLDKLIREVPIPEGLSDQLKRLIAQQKLPVEESSSQPGISHRSQTVPQSWFEQQRLSWFLAVAAVVLAMLTGGFWWMSQTARPIAQPAQPTEIIVEPLAAHDIDIETQQVVAQLAELQQRIADAEAQLAELDFRLISHRIEQQQSRWDRLIESQSSRDYPSDELTAWSLFVAAETVVQSGLPPQLVTDNLQLVIDRFPNTTGATRRRNVD